MMQLRLHPSLKREKAFLCRSLFIVRVLADLVFKAGISMYFFLFRHKRCWVIVPLVVQFVMLCTPSRILRAQVAQSVVPARPGQAEALARQRAAAASSASRPSQATLSPSALSASSGDMNVQRVASVPAAGLNQTLDRLALSATDFTHYVKNAVCREEIDSERQSTPGLGPRVLPAHVHAVSEMQVEVHDGHVEEHRKWISQDGRLLAVGQEANLPYRLDQAFAVPPSAYLSRAQRSCLRFSAQQSGRLDFQATSTAGKGTCADVGPQAAGHVLFEPQTDLILHIERSVPATTGAAGGFAPFAAVDYSSTEKNGRSYQLPSRIIATRQNRGYTLPFAAPSRCEILGTTVTITNSDGSPVDRTR